MKRLFFALDINKTARDNITQWRHNNLTNIGVPIVANNLHITLAFLGHVPIEKQTFLTDTCSALVAKITVNQPIKVTIDSIGLFKKPKVIYLGFSSFNNQLVQLANSLSERAAALDIFQERRPYLPHISIIRKAKQSPTIPAPALPLTIKSMSLYHSKSSADGVTYLPIHTWSLVQ